MKNFLKEGIFLKRLMTLSILVLMLIFLCACGKKSSEEVPESMIARISEAVDNASQAEGQGAVTVVPEGTNGTTDQSTANQSTGTASAAAGSTAAAPTPSPTPVPTVAPTATPVPTARIYYVTITKDPTSETVEEGGSATFVARANNATSINWIIVSPDAQTSYRAEEAVYHFSGVSVSGQGTESLTFFNIPASMDGWRVQCYFTGNGGPEYTMGAYITVTASAEKKQEAISEANACAAAVGQHANAQAPGVWTNAGPSSFSFSNGVGKFVVTLYAGANNENRLEVTCLCFPDNYAYYPVEVVWSTIDGTAVTMKTDTIFTKSTTYDKTADDQATGSWTKLDTELITISGQIH